MNNLFKYATKELTQDAVISCLLDEKSKTSIDFLNAMLLKPITNNVPIFDIKMIKNVYTQGKEKGAELAHRNKVVPSKADVFVIFLDNEGNKHAVIIEDKVDTFLHSKQMQKYIDNVSNYKNGFIYIHYVLFKTGLYYFWEKNSYLKYVEEYSSNHNQNNVFFYEYLVSDFEKFIDDRITKINFSWIRDYQLYIKELLLKANNNTYWAINYHGTIDDFADSVIDINALNNIDFTYEIGLPHSGSGKRQYEFKVYGICGKKAAKKEIGGSETEQYYLLPVITLNDDNTARCFLNIHKYSVVDEINKEGYSSKEKCSKLREQAIQIAKEKKCGFQLPKNGNLKVCSSKTIEVRQKYNQYDFSDVKKEFSKILSLAMELKNKFDN